MNETDLSLSNSNRSIQWIARQIGSALDTLADDFRGQNGTVSELFKRVRAIIRVLETPIKGDEIDSAVLELGTFLEELHRTMHDDPFRDPDIKRLREIGEELMSLRTSKLETERERQEMDERIRTFETLCEQHEHLKQSVGVRLGELAHGLEQRVGTMTEVTQLRAKLEAEGRRRHGLEARVAELQTKLAEKEHVALHHLISELRRSAPASPTDTIDFSLLDREIERRTVWFSEIDLLLQDAQSELEEVREGREQIEAELGLADAAGRRALMHQQSNLKTREKALEEYIKQLLEIERKERTVFGSVQRYREAITHPPESIGRALPPIPPIPDFEEGEVGEREPNTQVKADTEIDRVRPEHTSPAYQTLRKLARTYGLSAEGMVAITLYDLLPRSKDPVLVRRQKGILGVINNAKGSGLLERYGWNTVRSFLQSGWQGDEGERAAFEQFLRYTQKYRGMSIYRRTDDPLPWKTHEIVTAEEIETFLAQERAQQQRPRRKDQ